MPCSTRSATWRDQTLKNCRSKLKPASSPGIKTPSTCTCATWILDPGPPAVLGRGSRLYSSSPLALLPTLPTPTPKNPPGQSRTPSLQRSLKLVSSYSRIARTTLPSRALELAEPLRTTRPTATPHNTTDLTTAGTNGNVPGPPPQNLLERWHAGLHLLGPTAARDPVGLGHEHPAGPNRRILAEGAPTDPPAGIRCAP